MGCRDQCGPVRESSSRVTWVAVTDEPDHPLLRLADELETATDELAKAYDEQAEAEVVYKRAWSVALLRESKVAATLRSKFAEASCVEQQAGLTFAEAKVKRCRAKVDQLQSQLMAHQTYVRVVGSQT